jgi:hypothetical protein
MMDYAQTFRATTQYDDWDGECRADDGDFISIWDLLRERNLIHEGEFLIGIKTFNGENLRNQPLSSVYVHAIIIRASNFEEAETFLREHEDPLPTRDVRLELSVEEFARYFKRFSVAICQRSLSIVGRTYLADE